MKSIIAAIITIGVCLLIVHNLHKDGTMLLASIAEEYSICTNVNACTDDDLTKMADILVEYGVYRSKLGLRITLGWQDFIERFSPSTSSLHYGPSRYSKLK